MDLGISYYNWLERVGGKGASEHIGAYNDHPDIDTPFEQIFKQWRKEWQKQKVEKNQDVKK